MPIDLATQLDGWGGKFVKGKGGSLRRINEETLNRKETSRERGGSVNLIICIVFSKIT